MVTVQGSLIVKAPSGSGRRLSEGAWEPLLRVKDESGEDVITFENGGDIRTKSRVIALEAVEVGYNVTSNGQRKFVGTIIENAAHLTDSRFDAASDFYPSSSVSSETPQCLYHHQILVRKVSVASRSLGTTVISTLL